MTTIIDHPESAEDRLAHIVQETLGLPSVSRTSRYVDLGGNSVSLYLIIERVKSEMGIDLEPQLFFHPTQSSIGDIAREINGAGVPAVSTNA
jgi:acyl carrier protein